jgi:two-component system sensor histidine kinase/response regulator
MLSSAGAGRYGMVLMDVQMPEMDGHEATRRIRADARFTGLPIVAMTAHAMVEERERCFASGMDDHLAKPINPAMLYQAIGRWCPTNAYQTVLASEPAMAGAGNQGGELVIAGIDVQDGLRRMLGNRAFYLQMLERFRDGQRDSIAHIRAALNQDGKAGRKRAELMAHTLQGVAGQLGATGLQTLANQLEQDIGRGAGYETLQPLLDRLEQDMQSLQAALENVLPDPARPEAAAVLAADNVDRDAVDALLRRFAQLLTEYDGEAIDFLSEGNSMLAAALGQETHKKIARAVRQFDFDAALAALDAGARAAGYERIA